MAKGTPKGGKGLMSAVLSRMTAGECLISDRHTESMLVGLLSEAEQVTDPRAAWDEVRAEVCNSWGWEDGPEESRKPFIYSDGVAVIPVHGILINRFNWCWGFVTGYDFIRKQKNLALADPDVKLIVYDHDTPGGEAAGCDELAREIYADRGTKPSLALVNSLSASGGFWLAAPANKIVCAPSGSVGSIGVYIQLMRVKKMMAEWGIEVEYVKNGKFKTSGSPYEELSDDDRAYLQAMVDERAVEFHRAVAEFRGIEESVVKGTQARVMRPTEAIALGLIDAAEAPATAVSSFVAELGNDDPIGHADDSQEDAMAEMTSEEKAAVAAETKARIKGIMTSDEAKGREGLAEHLAYNTDQSVDEAVATLKVSPKAEAPKEEPETPAETDEEKKAREEQEAKDAEEAEKAKGGGNKERSQFEQRMDADKHPEIGQDGGGAGGDESAAKVAEILGDQTRAFGTKHKQTAKA